MADKLQSIEKEIIKEYGEVIMSASSVADRNQKIIRTGPKLDYALGGGIPEGSRVIISGPPKFGKTTLVLQIAANAQKMGKRIFYYDVEGRFKKMNLYSIKGFNADEVKLIASTKERLLSAQDFLQIAKILMKAPENIGSVHIIDSLSQLCPDEVLGAGNVSGTRRSTTPKLIKDFFLQVAGIIPVMDITLLAIQHIIANTSGFGSPSMEDGGSNAQYQSDVKLRGVSTPTKIMEGEKQVGQKITWDVVTSALGSPGGKIESYLKFGYGVDDASEIIELCADFNIIKKSGAWFYLPEKKKGEDLKFQGMANTADFLYQNPKELEALKKAFEKVAYGES